ncbi:hypothetical protein [Clostridium aciditolerans]|uniref:ABC-2 family transporter protein n=1 Tax=Clostridium aciditolerans TaxID=339861 RepID=A0A934HX43_9CLOT|nr:hypothetical protein [Clostridium aciditolerans]MBI6872378.1 hypothetical protein [Clostridium aciditolerans]
MNTQEGNKLKFQLLTILRQNIWNLITTAVIGFCLALFSIQNLYPLRYGYDGKTSYDLFWLLAIFANVNTALAIGYKETVAYFLNLSYTREKYYKGNMMFSFIISFITSIVILLVYIINLLKDKLYKLNGIVSYMGFSFEGFTAYSYVKIVFITFILITFICAFANFISVISLSSKFIRIIINFIIFGSIFLVIFQEKFGNKLIKFISYINSNLTLALMFYLASSIILYILAKKVLMHIDID